MPNGYPTNNVYIGARYVPKLVGEWDSTKETAYEPLIIVTYQGNSYTSRQYVPAGIDISNTEYWVLTGNFNGQIESLRMELKAIKNTQDGLRPLSSFEGITPSEKYKNAFDTAKGVILDSDVEINADFVISKHRGFITYGNGYTINLKAPLYSTLEYGQNYFFIGVNFTGSASFNLNYNFLGVRFIMCTFEGFTTDIFVGSAQSVSFHNCYFHNNAGWVFKLQRADNLLFADSNVEDGTNNFCKISEIAYGCSFQNSVIESVTGVVFDLPAIHDFRFDSLYFEDNGTNIIITKDFCGNVSISNLHANLKLDTDALVTLRSGTSVGRMYGTLQITGSSIDKGILVQLDVSDGSRLGIDLVNNSGFSKAIKWNNPIAGAIDSTTVKTKRYEVTGVFPASHNIQIRDAIPDIFGHKLLGVTVTTAVKDGSVYFNDNVMLAQIADDAVLIINGNNSDSITYILNILYL